MEVAYTQLRDRGSTWSQLQQVDMWLHHNPVGLHHAQKVVLSMQSLQDLHAGISSSGLLWITCITWPHVDKHVKQSMLPLPTEGHPDDILSASQPLSMMA